WSMHRGARALRAQPKKYGMRRPVVPTKGAWILHAILLHTGANAILTRAPTRVAGAERAVIDPLPAARLHLRATLPGASVTALRTGTQTVTHAGAIGHRTAEIALRRSRVVAPTGLTVPGWVVDATLAVALNVAPTIFARLIEVAGSTRRARCA